jgi:cell division transport system ATP-binding protein
MLFLDKVSKKYADNTDALNGVTLLIKPKEFVSIVGHSGAGKTTLLKMILAEEKPTEGDVTFENINIHKIRKSDMNEYRRRIGTVFQDFRLLADKTAYENVAFAMRQQEGQRRKFMQTFLTFLN